MRPELRAVHGRSAVAQPRQVAAFAAAAGDAADQDAAGCDRVAEGAVPRGARHPLAINAEHQVADLVHASGVPRLLRLGLG